MLRNRIASRPRFAVHLGRAVAVALLLCGAFAASARGANFTFFMTADTHYGLDLWDNNEARNKETIDDMNNLPGTPFPASLGGVVDMPQGVLVAGDLTDTPTYINFYGLPLPPPYERDGFNQDYAVDGSGRLHYPVYEGYGNHDVDTTSISYTLEGLQQRNLVRQGIVHLSANGLLYSWDWQGVHFINLNIYPGTDDRTGDSLDFLKDDLAHYLTSKNEPIVLMHHFGFDSFSLGWWTDAQRQAYADAIDGYNVLGIFHGHLHTTMHYQWDGYDVFDGSAAKDGNYLVVRIANGRMDVAAREDNQWTWTFSKAIQIPEPATWIMALAAAGSLAVVVRARHFPIHRGAPRRRQTARNLGLFAPNRLGEP